MKIVRIYLAVLFIPFTLLVLSSCVNEEYDLSKDVDMEMTVLKNVSLPIGDVETITLNKLLTIDEDSEVIKVSETGDYSISFSGENISTEVEVPEIAFDDFLSEESVIKFGTGVFAGMTTPSGMEGQKVSYSSLYGEEMVLELELDVHTSLPAQVKDIDYVRFSSYDYPICINMTVDDGAMHISEGFSISFPAEITVNDADATRPYSVLDGHEIVFKEDIKITKDTPFQLELSLDTFTLPDKAITYDGVNRSIAYNNVVTVVGDAYINTADFEVVPENIDLTMTARISDLKVDEVSLQLDFETDIADTEVSVSGIPDFLKGDNVCIDIYNPAIVLSIDNYTPLAFAFNADVIAHSTVGTHALMFGPWEVGSEESVVYQISRREFEGELPAETVQIILPSLVNFFTPLPDMISIENVKMQLEEKSLVVRPGEKFSAAMSYSISAPLAFDKDLNLNFTTDIKNLGIDFEAEVGTAELTLDIVNSVPVNFNIAGVAIDKDGNPVKDITLSLDKNIAAGSQASPVTTGVKLTLNNPSGSFKFDGLRLEMTADTGETAFNGTPLNKNQGLKINNLVISVPEGVTLNAE